MQKSEWLPTLPLHVAIWSQIILDSDLSWADQGKAIRLLANAWSSGELVRAKWASDEAWQAANRLWPEMLEERDERLRARDRNRSRAKTAADARWNAPRTDEELDAPSNAPSMLEACSKHRRSDQDQDQDQEHDQDQEQDQESPSLRSGDRGERALRRVPDDFELTQERFEYGLEQGLTVEAIGEEFEQFRDHRYRSPRTKWDLAWKAWVRKAVEIRGLGVSRRGPPQQTAAARTMTNVEEFLKQSGAL